MLDMEKQMELARIGDMLAVRLRNENKPEGTDAAKRLEAWAAELREGIHREILKKRPSRKGKKTR